MFNLSMKFGSPLQKAIAFLLKFTNQATTNAATGVRELVNTGTNGVNATIYGGQGLDGAGSTLTIATGYTHNGTTPFTYRRWAELVGWEHFIFTGTGDVSHYINTVVQADVLLSSLDLSTIAIGQRIEKDYLLVEQVFTTADILADYLNPEKTAYWVGSTFTSDISGVATSTVYWYPFCDNVNSVDQNNIHYSANACLPRPANAVTNGGFDTDTDWSKSAWWTISGGVATMPNTDTFYPLESSGHTFTAEIKYTIEFEVLAITGAFGIRLSNGGDTPVGYVNQSITTTGLYRLSVTPSIDCNTIAFARGAPDSFASFTIDNVKVYPYAGSGLTPINGMTTTTPRTNAAQIQYGLQMPLLTYDAFGVPTGLVTNVATPYAGENLVVNGDFSNGTTSWVSSGGSTFTVTDGEAKVVADANGYEHIVQTIDTTGLSTIGIAVSARAGVAGDRCEIIIRDSVTYDFLMNSEVTRVTDLTRAYYAVSVSGHASINLYLQARLGDDIVYFSDVRLFPAQTGNAINWEANTIDGLKTQALAENNLDLVVTGDPVTAIDIYEA
jgi:hypothetical protein